MDESLKIPQFTDQVGTEMPVVSVEQTISPMFGVVLMVIILVVALVCLTANWKIFTKAGKPGWAAIVPIYNIVVFLQIIGRPGWWVVLFFVPFVNMIISVLMSLDLAKVFGKSSVFGIIALWLFPVGYLVLGFGKAKYLGPGSDHTSSSNPPPAPAMSTSESQIPSAPQAPPEQGPSSTTI